MGAPSESAAEPGQQWTRESRRPPVTSRRHRSCGPRRGMVSLTGRLDVGGMPPWLFPSCPINLAGLVPHCNNFLCVNSRTGSTSIEIIFASRGVKVVPMRTRMRAVGCSSPKNPGRYQPVSLARFANPKRGSACVRASSIISRARDDHPPFTALAIFLWDSSRTRRPYGGFFWENYAYDRPDKGTRLPCIKVSP